MTSDALQELCETGQEKLMRMDYLGAEAALAEAERQAWEERDWDTLARLYMPLQEARRQRRLRCGEGVVALDLIAQGPDDHVSGRRVAENYPHGQLLVAGWGTIEPAVELRQIQASVGLFVETFLGAVYPIRSEPNARIIALVPHKDVQLPPPDPALPIHELTRALPDHTIVLPADSLPTGGRRGTTETFAQVSALWEQLHLPFLAAADTQADPIQRIEHYRRTIGVDYACELAHQKLSDVARQLLRQQRVAK
jgi:hypothetical protein